MTRSVGPKGRGHDAAEIRIPKLSAHYQKDDHPLFVTFATDRRWDLPPEARDIVFECCLNENGHKFDLHADVVMPDHVHLIYSPLRREDGWSSTLPETMKTIKGDRHGTSISR